MASSNLYKHLKLCVSQEAGKCDLKNYKLISSRALTSLKEKAYNKVHVLPLTNDLLILRNFLNTEIKKEVAAAKTNLTNESWIRLCQLTFAAVTLFNRRRGGEVAKMNIKCYTQKPNWGVNEEFEKGLSSVEKKLMRR